MSMAKKKQTKGKMKDLFVPELQEFIKLAQKMKINPELYSILYNLDMESEV